MANCYSTMRQSANCCAASAAVRTSAPVAHILDTVILAVSIIIVLILGLRLGNF